MGSLCALCCSVLLIAAICNAAPVESESSGRQPPAAVCSRKTKLSSGTDCRTTTEVFQFDETQNRCISYHVCEGTLTESNDTAGVFESREECTDSCQATSCIQPGLIANGEQDLQELDNGLVRLIYNCQQDYLLEGDKFRVCQFNGSWTGKAPRCRRRCPQPMEISNGRISYQTCKSNPVAGCIVLYACQKGYISAFKNAPRICLDNGTWSGNDPSCVELVITHKNNEVKMVTAPRGDGIHLDCIMKPNFPEHVKVSWTFPTQQHTNYNVSWSQNNTAFSLYIPHLNVKDSGDYNCKVVLSNNVMKKKIAIQVKSPVQETAVDLYRSVNDSFGSNLVRYDCTFRGVPRPNVVWYRNGEQIRPNLYLEISNFVFTFILVNKSENAVYKCFGSNEFSEREATFYLNNSRARRHATGVLVSKMIDPGKDTFYVGKGLKHIEGTNSYQLTVSSRTVKDKQIVATSVKPLSFDSQETLFLNIRTSGKAHIITEANSSSKLLQH